MSDTLPMAAIITGGVVLGLLIVVGLPIILSFRHAARDRAFEHAERLKALELGRPWPGDHSGGETATGGKGAAIGIWVPLGSLGIALAATTQSQIPQAAAIVTWIAAGCVGVAGVICGTIITLRTRAEGSASSPAYTAKPAMSADELEFASRRG